MRVADPKDPSFLAKPWTLDAPEGDRLEGGSPEQATLEPAAVPVTDIVADLPPGDSHTNHPPAGQPMVAPVPAAPPPLLRIIEAMLFIGGTPLSETRACETIRGLTAEQFRDLIAELNGLYRRQGRPYQIRLQDHGYVLALRPRFRNIEDRLHGSTREARLSQTAVDTLALVAYRQPATKQEIDAIRGSDSGNVLRQLVRRGLIAVQRGQADQREVSYCTTRRFLELFHLHNLDDLPQTQDLQKI